MKYIRYVRQYSQADFATSIRTVLYNTHTQQFLCFVSANVSYNILLESFEETEKSQLGPDKKWKIFDMENIKIMVNDDNWSLSYGTWLLILYTIDHFTQHLFCRCGLNKWIGQQLMLLQVIWLFLQGGGGGGRKLD